MTAVACMGCPVLAPIDLTGKWEGTIAEERDGFEWPGELTGEVIQEGDTISGVWSSSFPDPRYNNGGSLTGTVDGNNLTATFAPSNSRYCSFIAVATFTRNTIEGSYSAVSCSVTQTGTVELHRVHDKGTILPGE